MTHAYAISAIRSQWVVGRGAPRDVTTLGVEVIAIFGPTASGKSAVAQALASAPRHRGRLGRCAPGLSRPADPDEPAGRADAPRSAIRDLVGDDVGRRVRRARARRRSTSSSARTGRPSSRAAPGCTCVRRSSISRSRLPSSPRRARTSSASTTRDPAAAHERLGRARSAAAAASVHVNDRRRVVRALELAEVGASLDPDRATGSGRRIDAPPDARRRARRLRRTSSSGGSARAPTTWSQRGVVDEARGAMRHEPSRRPPQRRSGSTSSRRLPLDEARERIVAANTALRRVPAEVDAADPGHRRSSMPTGRPRRWSMRSSTWRALGNTYASSSRAPSRSTRREHQRSRRDADGVLEVLASTSTTVEIAIWNPDGSRAELSGNGTRIAAAWLAAQSGAREIDVGVGARIVRTRILEDGEIEQELGEVTVGAQEIDRTESRSCRSRSAIRTPSCSATRRTIGDDRPAARDARALSRAARTCRSRASTLPARSPRASGSEGWGRRCRRARAPSPSPRPRTATARSSSTSREAISASASTHGRATLYGTAEQRRLTQDCASSTSRPSGSRRYAERPHG